MHNKKNCEVQGLKNKQKGNGNEKEYKIEAKSQALGPMRYFSTEREVEKNKKD